MKYRGILKGHASSFSVIFYVADWLTIAGTGWLSYWLYLDSLELPSQYSTAIGISILIAAWLFPRFSLYQAWRGASLLDEIRSVVTAWLSVLLTLMVFAFAFKIGPAYSRAWISIWGLLGGISLVTSRTLLRYTLRKLRKYGFNQRNIVIVGSVENVNEVMRRLQLAPWIGLKICGLFYADKQAATIVDPGIEHMSNLDLLSVFLECNKIDQVWIALPLSEEEKLKQIIYELRHSTVDIRFVPDLFGMRLLNQSITDVVGLPVINLSATPMVGTNKLLKSLEDRVLAVLILILILPVMILVAIAVKLSSSGPILYRQERIGWNGKSFVMYKFRTMPVELESDGVEWGGVGKSKKPTRIGSILRKTSLDELPQFINVLKGEMSIVGPRPERRVFVEKFKDEIPGYMKKHLVKAGITGWAQINGWRGDTDLHMRLEYDLYYIEHWSIWFDLKIILLTVFKGMISKNAY